MEDLEKWPTKQDVMAALYCSERTIENTISAGELRAAYRPFPERKPVVIMRPEDFEKRKQARAHHTHNLLTTGRQSTTVLVEIVRPYSSQPGVKGVDSSYAPLRRMKAPRLSSLPLGKASSRDT